MIMPPPAAAVTFRKWRRVTGTALTSVRPSSAISSAARMDGLADAQVGAAAAEVAGHGGIDVGVGGVGLLGQERGGGHDLAGLAVAALGDADLDPGELDGVRLSGVPRPSMVVISLADGGGDGRDAGADRFAVEVDGAGAALGDAAAVFCAGMGEVFADYPQQRSR